jgi:hypothetical protein
MTRQLLLSLFLVTLATPSAFAHHKVAGRAHPVDTMVRITEPVMAGGHRLEPGVYEVVVNDEKPATPEGAPSEAQRTVDFLMNGKVVATEIAEMFPLNERGVVGTSGTTGGRARVERLKQGDFVRIVASDANARYFIHLPTADQHP